VADDHLGLKVGIPISILFLLTVLVIIITAALVLLTRHYKRKSYEVVCRRELARLSISNAYISSAHLNPFAFLEPYDIEYNYASLEIVGELGEGAFGRVYKARAPGIKRGDYIPPEFVAVKTLKEEAEYEAVEEFCKEVKVCVQFEHENVIRLLAVCTTAAQKCMIFEFMDLGNLGELLRFSDPDSPSHPEPNSQQITIAADMLLPIVLQVANGLNYLAKLKFVHRDIATRNCLMNSNLTVKIADFGMSREVSSMDYYRIGSSKACLPVRWMPPEALMYGKFTLKSDVWSYGVLVWEVYSYGRQPHTGISNYEVIDRIKEGRLLECPTHCPPAIFDIMKSCWTRSPAKRATMETIWSRLNQLNKFGPGKEESESSKAAEGYLNLAFADVISEEELAESEEVEAALNERRERELADIAELLEDSDDEQEGDGEEEERDEVGRGNYDATEIELGSSKETEYGQERGKEKGSQGMENNHDLNEKQIVDESTTKGGNGEKGTSNDDSTADNKDNLLNLL
jgi:serine/threonine protein kinase